MSKLTLLLSLTLLHTLSHSQPQCPTSCQKCPTPNTCVQCLPPTNLNDRNACRNYTTIENCRIYSSQQGKNQCVACDSGYGVVKGKCYRLARGCVEGDSGMGCVRCGDGYRLVGGLCFFGEVGRCPVGTFVFKDYCRPYPLLYCLKKKDQICQLCSPNYTLTNGVCLPTTCTIQSPTPTCPPSTTLQSSLCYSCKPPNCLQSPNNIHCTLCDASYVLIDGLCYRPVKLDDPNCNLVDLRTQVCTGCNHDYRLDRDGYCVRDFGVGVGVEVEVEGQGNGGCAGSMFFDFFEGNCYYKDRFCVRINRKTYQCVDCAEGYGLKGGKCQRIQRCIRRSINGDCIDCFQQYYLHPSTRTCQQKPRNCLNLNLQTSQCNLCQSPTQLTTQTKTNRTVCAYIQQKCQQYNNQGTCISCVDGYGIRNRVCEAKAQFCAVVNGVDFTVCVVCVDGYVLRDGRCYGGVAGCGRYGADGECVQCGREFVLSGGKCLFSDKYCLQIDQEGNCIRCSQGLVPFTNKCVYYQHFCASYGLDRVCNKTYNGFSLKTNVSNQDKQQYRIFVLSSMKSNSTNKTKQQQTRNLSQKKGYYTQAGIIHTYPSLSLQSKSIKQLTQQFTLISCIDPSTTPTHQLCLKKSQQVPNCSQYNRITLQCIQCRSGYDMSSQGRCQRRSARTCLQVELGKEKDKERCGRCNQVEGYVDVGGWCLSKLMKMGRDKEHFEDVNIRIMWPLLPNCNEQRELFKCFKCQYGYTYVEGQCVIYQKYCQTYHYYGFCQKCVKGYNLEGGNCVPSNCQKLQQSICSSCLKGYEYQNGKCYPPKLTNCITYNKTSCKLCLPSHYLSKSLTCQPLPPNCTTISPTTLQCTQCLQTHTLFQHRCYLHLPNCDTYSFDNKCLKCRQQRLTRYQLVEGNCVRVPSRCGLVGKDGECVACEVGYRLVVGGGRSQCVEFREGCVGYDRNGRCVSCSEGLVLRNGNCYGVIQGCMERNQVNKCTKCMDGYQVSNQGGCNLLDPKCKKFNNGYCSQCMQGHYISTVGVGICIQNPQNCAIYSQPHKKCLQCIPNHLLHSNTCQSTKLLKNGCKSKTSLQPTCTSCQQGYQLRQGLCYASNCVRYSRQRDCEECGKYYKKSVANPGVCMPFFCASYRQGEASCDRYEIGFGGGFKIHRSGRIQIEYCKEYNSTDNTCITCQSYRHPFKTLPFHPCYPSNCLTQTQSQCPTCLPNFLPDPTGTCIAQYCHQFNQDGTCKTCMSPYIRAGRGICVRNGACIEFQLNGYECRRCERLYGLVGGRCVVGNCVREGERGVGLGYGCEVCEVGFERGENWGCRVKNCKDQAKDYTCQACMQNYKLNKTLRICEPKNCKTYNESTLICLACETNFYLDNTLCRPKNCLKQQKLQCITCQKGYILNSIGSCQIEYCKQFNSQGNCQKCKSGYIINKQNKLCQIEKNTCQTYNPNQTCTKCIKNYILTPTNTCIRQTPGCKTYLHNQCQSCLIGYEYRFEDKSCKVLYCQSYQNQNQNEDGVCIKCRSGYQLTKEGLCRVANCEIFSEVGWSCNSCYGRFGVWDAVCRTKNCVMFSVVDQITCLLCQQDYTLVDGACLHKNCQTPKHSTCKTCLQGWLLNTNKICSIRDCLQTNSDTVGSCRTCTPGKRLRDGLCLSDRCLLRSEQGLCGMCQSPFQVSDDGRYCVAGFCLDWDWSNGECYGCGEDFLLRDGICVNKYCRKYDGNMSSYSSCLSCQQGYYPYNQYCIPNKCQKTAYRPLTSMCQKCIFGYQPIQGLCKLQNCNIFFKQQDTKQKNPNSPTCKQCRVGYQKKSQLCIATNCQQHQPSSTSCKKCLQGYNLLIDICVLANCLTFDQWGVCTECQTGFQFQSVPQSDNKLICKRKYCLQEQFQRNRCLRCQDGYAVLEGGFCLPVNCKVVGSGGQSCQRCQIGFVKDSGICLDLNCEVFNPIYQCQQCKKGFKYIPSLNICQPQYPSFCPLTQYYSQQASKCQKIPIPNCKRSLPNQPHTCIQCTQLHFLHQNQCHSVKGCRKYSYVNGKGCTECEPKFRLVGNICVEDGAKAQAKAKAETEDMCIFKLGGRCAICRDTYYLNQNKECIEKPVNCKQYSKDFKCVKCQGQFQMVNQQRGCKASNCLSFNQDNLKCKQCSGRYSLNPTKFTCQKQKISNCLEQTDNKCTKCQQNYILSHINNTQTCIPKIPNCQHYSPTAPQCQNCTPGHTLQNNNCIKLKEGCQYTGADGQCLLCKPGFVLIGEGCMLAKRYCEGYDFSGGCVRCGDGYYLRGGECYGMPGYCLEVGVEGDCMRCDKGYVLTQQKTCQFQPKKQTQPPLSPPQLPSSLPSTLPPQLPTTPQTSQSQLSYIDNCLHIDDINELCKICNMDYYLTVSGKCLPMPQNCWFVNSQGMCYLCADGYRLVGGACQEGKGDGDGNRQGKEVGEASQVQKQYMNLRRKDGRE